MPQRLALAAPILSLALAAPAAAGQVSFSGWTEQKFRLFSKVDFRQAGQSLAFQARDAASLIWTQLPQAEWGARGAAWSWRIDASVPATDLTRKGGDDRNAALYFVFLPRIVAEAARARPSIRALLADPQARVLVYVWGGAHRRGEVLESPYLGARGKTVVLRAAGTGTHGETVDLARDFNRAFGTAPEALVGVAVSADSDDTDSTLAGQIDGLTLR